MNQLEPAGLNNRAFGEGLFKNTSLFSHGVNEQINYNIAIAGSHHAIIKQLTSKVNGATWEGTDQKGKKGRQGGSGEEEGREADSITLGSPWIQVYFKFTLVFQLHEPMYFPFTLSQAELDSPPHIIERSPNIIATTLYKHQIALCS